MTQHFKQTGTKQLTDDLELKDFTWEIVNYGYSPVTDQTWVEIEAWEIHKRHNRRFDIEKPETGVMEEIVAKVMKLDAFAGSTPVTS